MSAAAFQSRSCKDFFFLRSVFDADFNFQIHDIAEELAICHGAADTLAVADAFARYAALREGTELRDRLDQYLVDCVDQKSSRKTGLLPPHSSMCVINGRAGAWRREASF